MQEEDNATLKIRLDKLLKKVWLIAKTYVFDLCATS